MTREELLLQNVALTGQVTALRKENELLRGKLRFLSLATGVGVLTVEEIEAEKKALADHDFKE